MARPGIVTAVTTACGGAAVGPVEDHAVAIQARNRRCQGGIGARPAPILPIAVRMALAVAVRPPAYLQFYQTFRLRVYLRASTGSERSGRAMSNLNLTIADEVAAAIAAGSAERCCEMAERVTALFVASAASFDIEQHALFADIFERLVNTIELRALADISARIALAELSAQLAPVSQAPASVIRRLARHDEISIAGPVLSESPKLGVDELIEIARTKSEQHLLAIAGRWWLQEIVSDELLKRRYRSVSLRLVKNPG